MYRPDVQSMTELVLHLFDDLADQFPNLSKGLERDKKYILQRASSEGLSFFTIALPKYGKAFDEWLRGEDALKSRVWVPDDPEQVSPKFTPQYWAPQFLVGVHSIIYADIIGFSPAHFDEDGFWVDDYHLPGTELKDSDRAALYRWIRQLSFLFYKLEVPFTEKQLHEAYCSFEKRDNELEETDCSFSPFDTGEAARIVADTLQDFNSDLRYPKHGPGSVATGEIGDEKWNFKRKYASVHRRYPWYEYFVPSPLVWHSDPKFFCHWYRSLESLSYPVSRVVAVPKDSRGPRLISEEPLELQFLQQGYCLQLVAHLEHRAPTVGFVNFAKQSINQRLALEGSITGEWATIDLSDASDRVSDYLVYLLFPKSKYQDMRALRSYSTLLPNGRIVQLKKFAAMGSAICFPVEALVFWALSRAAIREATKGGDGPVYVYGDDIIVRREHFEAVCEGLEKFGLKVNRSKSYHTGFFRESCGVDAWKGYNITPARVRHFPPSKSTSLESLTNWIAVSNMLRDRCYYRAAGFCQGVVDSVVKIPWNVYGTQLSFMDNQNSPDPSLDERNKSFKFRWNPVLCRQEIRCTALKQKLRVSSLSGWPRLHRNLLMNPREPDKWSPRRAVGTRVRWVSVHPYSSVQRKEQ